MQSQGKWEFCNANSMANAVTRKGIRALGKVVFVVPDS